MDRRAFSTALLGAAANSLAGSASAARAVSTRPVVLYRSIGEQLTHFDVDVEAATLTARASITLPSLVHYAWPHPSGRYLYACTSDVPGGSATGTVHRLCALRILADGALALHGEPQVLPSRPIHNSVDGSGAYVLTCFNHPASIGVHRINADGTLGAQVPQSVPLDFGIYPHQVRTLPRDRAVVVVTRGNRATATRAEEPGALKLYRFQNGALAPLATLPVGGRGGLGYGPRHVDFHPTQPWAYVLVELQNQLHMHRFEGDALEAEPRFNKSTLRGATAAALHQVAGAIHVHPRGHVLYMTNRASGTVDFNGQNVFAGGENNIAVFAIDRSSGEPNLIQHAELPSIHARTFSIDPSGRLLIAATIAEMQVREGGTLRRVSAGLVLYRIADDGRLNYVRQYDVDLGGKSQAWVGMMNRPA